jgi:glutathione S-transferase
MQYLLEAEEGMSTAMKLYNEDISGNCYKVRLFCALIEIPVEIVPVDFANGAHTKSPLIELNPLGQLPVLEDGDIVLRDSQAILIYLARKFGGEAWFPTEPASMARVAQWLMVAENEITRGPADARRHDKFGRQLDIVEARANTKSILTIMDRHLEKRRWLALGRPTIADIACMPYVALSSEGGVPLGPYPAVSAWVQSVKNLPNFVSMPGIDR